mgnify:CR=1 FL=1
MMKRLIGNLTERGGRDLEKLPTMKFCTAQKRYSQNFLTIDYTSYKKGKLAKFPNIVTSGSSKQWIQLEEIVKSEVMFNSNSEA